MNLEIQGNNASSDVCYINDESISMDCALSYSVIDFLLLQSVQVMLECLQKNVCD